MKVINKSSWIAFCIFLLVNTPSLSQDFWRDEFSFEFKNEKFKIHGLVLLKNHSDTVAVFPGASIKKILKYRSHVKEHFFYDSTMYNLSDIIEPNNYINAVFVHEDKIWVGLAFYEGGGSEGLGGIGFYDTKSKSVGILYHPALVDYSINELLVTDEVIYAKTYGYYELTTSYGNGLVSINKRTLEAEAKVLPGSELIFDKDNSSAVNEIYKSPIKDLMSDNRLRLIEVKQLPHEVKLRIKKIGADNYMIEQAKE